MTNLSRFKKATSTGNTINIPHVGAVSEYKGVRGANYYFSFCYVGSCNVDIYNNDLDKIATNVDLLGG